MGRILKGEFEMFKQLEEKINQVFGGRGAFAAAMGMSSRTITSRLNGKTEFTWVEIRKAGKLLGLTGHEVDELFFGIK